MYARECAMSDIPELELRAPHSKAGQPTITKITSVGLVISRDMPQHAASCRVAMKSSKWGIWKYYMVVERVIRDSGRRLTQKESLNCDKFHKRNYFNRGVVISAKGHDVAACAHA
jgi:hypothetical protein